MSKPGSVQLKLLKRFGDLKAGETAYFEASLADKLVLDDAAELFEDDFDRAIERITAENPASWTNYKRSAWLFS